MLPDPLHPAVVHFPIVLTFLLPLAALAGLWRIRRGAPARPAWGLATAIAAALTFSAWLAVETGEADEEGVERVVAEAPLENHEHAAERFLVFSAVVLAAAGAGMNLALGCDIRLASTAAKFTQAFVKRGLHPDWGGTYFLPRLVGMAKACELIFTGEIIDAQEALRLGIVNAVYAPEELMPAAYELARKIAAGPPVAIRLAKRALYHSEETDLRGALEFETFAQNVCSETEDAREGIRAFVEKRAPSFKGR